MKQNLYYTINSSLINYVIALENYRYWLLENIVLLLYRNCAS